MKEMNSLENQLRSWQPRRPSAGLERRIFPARGKFLRKMAWAFGSLAPVTACALLSLLVFNSGNSGISSRQEAAASLILGDPKYAAYAADEGRGRENKLFSVTFDWTRSGNLTSSIAPFLGNRMH